MGSALQSRGRAGRVALIAAFGVAAATSGCTPDLEFDNVVPVVTAVGPIGLVGQDTVRMHLWVQDYEADPVDVAVTWEAQGAEAKAIVTAPGGHGLVGLTSDPEWPGMEHVIMWDVTGVPRETPLRIAITPDDRRAGAGDPVTTEPFTLSAGVAEPITF
jgi:peptidyl-tRNA hydrolase